MLVNGKGGRKRRSRSEIVFMISSNTIYLQLLLHVVLVDLLPQLFDIAFYGFVPFRIDIVEVQVRRAIRALRSLSVFGRITKSQMRPRVAAEILDIKILIARALDNLLIMHARARPNGVHSSGFIVFVPGAAIMLPHSMLDPFL